MTTFLRLAEECGLAILGYLSAAGATFEHDAAPRPRVVIRPCIVVGRDEDKAPVEALLDRARAVSPVVRALGEGVRIDAEIVVVGPDAT